MSTLSMVRWHRSDEVDLENLTGAAFYDLLVSIKRVGRGTVHRIVDVHFRDQMRDPVAGSAGLREDGAVLRRRTCSAIRDHFDAKPRGKFGKHAHTPEEWGFTKEGIRAQTRGYVEAFGVEIEE